MHSGGVLGLFAYQHSLWFQMTTSLPNYLARRGNGTRERGSEGRGGGGRHPSRPPLSRTFGIWTGEPGLVASTHFPAERRPLKVHNVETALLALEEHGCRVQVPADEVVNGVRSSTLHLLWSLLSCFQVCFSFDCSPH